MFVRQYVIVVGLLFKWHNLYKHMSWNEGGEFLKLETALCLNESSVTALIELH
jgi:hypothetical protein